MYVCMQWAGGALLNAVSTFMLQFFVGADYPVMLFMYSAFRKSFANPSEPGGWVVLPPGEADLTSF